MGANYGSGELGEEGKVAWDEDGWSLRKGVDGADG